MPQEAHLERLDYETLKALIVGRILEKRGQTETQLVKYLDDKDPMIGKSPVEIRYYVQMILFKTHPEGHFMEDKNGVCTLIAAPNPSA
jgi:hypothetical protein